MEPGLISVIIPVYNNIDKLINCLDSVCRQSYRNLEILCIDDGSTVEVSQQQERMVLQDDRVQFVRRPHNKGPGAARNYGIQIASGEYVVFIDSDDTILADMLEQMMEEVQKDRELEVVMCGFRLHMDKVFYGERVVPYYNGSTYGFCGEKFQQAYRNFLINAPWNKLIKREFLITNNIYFDENIWIGEDLLFSLEVINTSSKIAVLDKALYNYYYFTPGSLTTKYNDDMDEIVLRIGEKLFQCTSDYPEYYSYYCADLVHKMLAFLKQIWKNEKLNQKKKREKVSSILRNKKFQQYTHEAVGYSRRMKVKINMLKCIMVFFGNKG